MTKKKTEKQKFLKDVIVLVDTREQKNAHILDSLEAMGVPFEVKKLDLGDYSFRVGDKDFSMSCVIERKANVEELYTNIMQERGRIEKEFYAASCLITQLTLLVESVGSFEELKNYKAPEWQMQNLKRKVSDIGRHCHATVRAWMLRDRYGFSVEFCKDKNNTATKLLELFYYYYHNYKELIAARRG